ncbi:MAG: HAD hydrolase-like protein, partial [Duncaniella sp.]|nr:HAD hydrolase-like protein [Duncaniella sp.]
MKYKNIIFDFDGTLVDTAPVILAAMAATFDELGLPAPSVEKCKSVIGLRLEDIGSRLYPDIDGINARFAEVYQRVFRTVNRPGDAKPFPGVIETLRELKAEGLNLAIASSRKHFSLEDFINELHLEGLFD